MLSSTLGSIIFALIEGMEHAGRDKTHPYKHELLSESFDRMLTLYLDNWLIMSFSHVLVGVLWAAWIDESKVRAQNRYWEEGK